VSQPRLLCFTLDSWTALGGRVSVSLLSRTGVLVGRNGAGKSAILEGFEAISSYAVGRFSRSRQLDVDSIPKILEIDISTPTERQLRYIYELVVLSTSTDELDSTIDDSGTESSEVSQFSWNERCHYIDGNQEVLWTTDVGVTTFSDGNVAILGSTSSLRQTRLDLSENPRLKLLDEMQWIYTVLSGVRLLGKDPIRQTYIRRSSLLQVSRKRIVSSSSFLFRGVDSLARKILRMKTEELSELESICQRIGIGSKITIQKFVSSEDPQERSEEEHEEYIASVSLDGVNIGLLSDGTLRVLTLLLKLIVSHPCATTIIEEPETQIHPGMLAKLLNEIETYTFNENLILSTHSPQVVAWTRPDKINLVYRDQGRTMVRKLHEKEIQKVLEYLYEEGDLGEWIYSGVLDE